MGLGRPGFPAVPPEGARPLAADAPLLEAFAAATRRSGTPFWVPGHKRRARALDADLGLAADQDIPLYGGLDTMKLTGGNAAEGRGAGRAAVAGGLVPVQRRRRHPGQPGPAAGLGRPRRPDRDGAQHPPVGVQRARAGRAAAGVAAAAHRPGQHAAARPDPRRSSRRRWRRRPARWRCGSPSPATWAPSPTSAPWRRPRTPAGCRCWWTRPGARISAFTPATRRTRSRRALMPW